MTDRLQLDVYDSDADAFEATAERAVEILRAAGSQSRITVALSGGRGGRGVMTALAARNEVPWAKIDWFLADERCVPADHQHSNLRLARENLLAPRRVTKDRVHRVPTDAGDVEAVAAAYAEVVRAAFGGAPPVFDLILLGLGPDGHVASLPPGCAALSATGPVAAVHAAELSSDPKVDRVTLTPAVLTAARHVLLTACGKEKSGAVAAALREPIDVTARPAQLVQPMGRVAWLIDLAAAEDLLHDATPAPQ